MQIVLLLLALLGHTFLWIGVINRLHAIGVRRKVVKSITALCFVCMAAMPIGLLVWIARQRGSVWEASGWRPQSPLVQAYFAACWIAIIATSARLAYLRLPHPPHVVRSHRRRRLRISVCRRGGRGKRHHHFFAHLPGNEILKLELSQWVLDVPRPHAALDDLSILHLSDLHFTGRIGKSYFHEVVRVCNELRPDIAAITGDIVDETACVDWIPEILGRLAARYGVYFILGNHDVLVDVGRRRTLTDSGLIDLGGRWTSVDIRGQSVILAGNELPWIDSAADFTSCPTPTGKGPLRIALVYARSA